MRTILIALALAVLTVATQAEVSMSIPDDFPQFRVPGHEKEMESVRALYWLHYPGSGPKATMWDIWLPSPSLWPATGSSDQMRRSWDEVLSSRIIDRDGYVSTHQHASIAHPLGWPFPFWNQGSGGFGWHFSFKDTVGPPWRPDTLSTTEGWQLDGIEDAGVGEYGWNLKLTEPYAVLKAPAHPIDTFQSPFIQIRWKATGLGNAQPYLEWTTKDSPRFGPDRRFYFEPVEGNTIAHLAIPIYKHPKWKGEIAQLRVGFGNPAPGASVTIQALFTQYDTRHNINSQSYIAGCETYFRWTRDLNFLRRNINRMRTALRYLMTEHQGLERKVIYTGWVGHDGIAGLKLDGKGGKQILSGHGIGNNYWDLMPFGNLDAYATILYYNSLRRMAGIEADIRSHPEWNIPEGSLALDPEMLAKHAVEVKAAGNRLFWHKETGRFIPGIGADGKVHDYGLTFLNLEAIHYGFATAEHARSIMAWISGKRKVEGDTSQGEDIYHWRFGPRATTRRNIEYYFWAWSGPETIPWGGQVQDGGAVLGWSYHDLMSRVRTLGPDDAWKRLQEVVRWFDEVQAAGGYRAYYNGSREGTLQGGGTAGGLGLDSEFFESVLVPQVMLDGFLGFSPTADGCRIDPKLPSSWPELTIDRIRLHDLTLRVRATKDTIEIRREGRCDEPFFVQLPGRECKLTYLMADGKERAEATAPRRSDGAYEVEWGNAVGVRFSAL